METSSFASSGFVRPSPSAGNIASRCGHAKNPYRHCSAATDVLASGRITGFRIGDTATCLRVAGEMIRDNVLYHYLGWAPQQGLGHSFGMAILRSSRLPSRDVAQWLLLHPAAFSVINRGTKPGVAWLYMQCVDSSQLLGEPVS